MYYYNGAQRYERFLQVGRLYRALILLGLALCFPSASVSSVFMVLCINFFCLHPSLYPLVSWAWWDWPLIWLTNHHPSVLWHCWLGHLTRKIVSEMTYNVSSGTLNPTIPYLWQSEEEILLMVMKKLQTLDNKLALWWKLKAHFTSLVDKNHWLAIWQMWVCEDVTHNAPLYTGIFFSL